MNTGVKISEAATADASPIGDLWIECLQLAGYAGIPRSADAQSAFRHRIEHPQGHSRIWVAAVGDEFVGWQGLIDFGATQIALSALSSTYVSPRWQHKKIGGQLLKHAMQYAADRGFEYVLGWIKSDNTASIKLVLSLGWELVGRVSRSRETLPELSYYSYAIPEPLTGAQRGCESSN
jgi:GNAT superfamily N-acetyltransferase